jgi:glutamate synthase domain-containing protein 1
MVSALYFSPKTMKSARHEEAIIEEIVAEEGLSMLGWRDVPVRSEILGKGIGCLRALHAPILRRSWRRLRSGYLL